MLRDNRQGDPFTIWSPLTATGAARRSGGRFTQPMPSLFEQIKIQNCGVALVGSKTSLVAMSPIKRKLVRVRAAPHRPSYSFELDRGGHSRIHELLDRIFVRIHVYLVMLQA